jgi:hypothetical protein
MSAIGAIDTPEEFAQLEREMIDGICAGDPQLPMNERIARLEKMARD